MNFPYSEGTALLSIIDGKDELVMYGDYYHDKIDHRISGFLEGLEFVGCTHEMVKTIEMNDDISMYDYFNN